MGLSFEGPSSPQKMRTPPSKPYFFGIGDLGLAPPRRVSQAPRARKESEKSPEKSPERVPRAGRSESRKSAPRSLKRFRKESESLSSGALSEDFRGLRAQRARETLCRAGPILNRRWEISVCNVDCLGTCQAHLQESFVTSPETEHPTCTKRNQYET